MAAGQHAGLVEQDFHAPVDRSRVHRPARRHGREQQAAERARRLAQRQPRPQRRVRQREQRRSIGAAIVGTHHAQRHSARGAVVDGLQAQGARFAHLQPAAQQHRQQGGIARALPLRRRCRTAFLHRRRHAGRPEDAGHQQVALARQQEGSGIVLALGEVRAHRLASWVVHALAQLGEMVEHPFDQPRIAVAVRLVQLLGVEEFADLLRRPAQRRQSALGRPAQQLAPHGAVHHAGAVAETVPRQPAVEGALGMGAPGGEVGIEQRRLAGLVRGRLSGH
ncbi:hypothetical protein D3C81_1197080 [compost metagenome]